MDDLREQLIEAIENRRFDLTFPSINHNDVVWLVDNCLLPRLKARDSKRDAYIIGEDENNQVLHAPGTLWRENPKNTRDKLRAEQRKRAKEEK